MSNPNSKTNDNHHVQLAWNEPPTGPSTFGSTEPGPSGGSPFRGLQTFQEITDSLMALVQPRVGPTARRPTPPPAPEPMAPKTNKPAAGHEYSGETVAKTACQPVFRETVKPEKKPLEFIFIWANEEKTKPSNHGLKNERIIHPPPTAAKKQTTPAPEPAVLKKVPPPSPVAAVQNPIVDEPAQTDQRPSRPEKKRVEPLPPAPPMKKPDPEPDANDETPTPAPDETDGGNNGEPTPAEPVNTAMVAPPATSSIISATLTAVSNLGVPKIEEADPPAPPPPPEIIASKETISRETAPATMRAGKRSDHAANILPGEYWDHVPVEPLGPGVGHLLGDLIGGLGKGGPGKGR